MNSGEDKEEIIEKWVSKAQEKFSYCENCQPYDSEDKEVIWVHGKPTYLQTILYDLDIPEELHEVVASRLNCPDCGTPLDICSEVGVISEYEFKVNERVERITEEIEPEIEEFYQHLVKFPYLGARHPIAEKIINEIKSIKPIKLENETWFRARTISTSEKLTTSDMLPPDPSKHAIFEGRFNHYGQSHYYLGSDPQGCIKEICGTTEKVAWIQKVKIKSLDVVLDLTENWFEDWTESMDKIPYLYGGILSNRRLTQPVEHDSSWKPEYFIPRFIADICKEFNINGLIFPSAVYSMKNIVVFNINEMAYSFEGEPEIFMGIKEEESLF